MKKFVKWLWELQCLIICIKNRKQRNTVQENTNRMRLQISVAGIKRMQVLLFPWGSRCFSIFFFYLVLFNQYSFQLSASSYHGSLAKCHQPSNASGYNLYHISSLILYLELLAFARTSPTWSFNNGFVKSRELDTETLTMF